MSAVCECGAPATVGNFCTLDLHRLETAIYHSPEIINDLEVTISGQDEQGGQGNGGGTPDPFNERASDARTSLALALREAAYTADGKSKGKTPPEHAAMALGSLENLARNPRGHAIHQMLREALREADKIRDRVEERVTYGPCVCGIEITAPKSKERAWCRGCGEEYDVRMVRAWKYVNALDRVHNYRGKLADVAHVLNGAGYHVKVDTLYQWKKRGKLTPEQDGTFTAKKVLEILNVT